MVTATVQPGLSSGTGVRSRKLRLLLPLVLLFIFAAQCVWFIRTQSLTFDEPVHILAGLDAWRNNRFELWNDHPPLGRLWCTLPLIDRKWQVEVTPNPWGPFSAPSVRPDPVAMAVRARTMNMLLGLALGVAMWFAARRQWSEPAADFALALFAFSPTLIANFSVVATDGLGALAIFLTGLQLLRWRSNPGWMQTALMGTVLGILLLSKFYTLPFFLLTLGLMLLLKPNGWIVRPWQWNWGRAISAAVLAIILLWAGYFFHTSHLTAANGVLTATYPNRAPLVKKVSNSLRLNLWVPAGEYVDGLRLVKFHNHQGHPSYFLGRTSWGGFKSYYPAIIILKWPTLVLLVFAAAAVLALRRKLRVPADFGLLAIYPAIMLLMALTAKIQIGERHILAVYPFMLLFAAGAWEWASGATQPNVVTPHRTATAVLVAALLLNAADTLRYAPNYLAYFNVFVPPSQSWKVASDSNLDWGQGLLALRAYERRHPDEVIHLAYFGSIHPDVYGIRALPLGESDRPTGTVVVSQSELSGQYLKDPRAYHWLLRYPLKTVLDHNLYVFEVK